MTTDDLVVIWRHLPGYWRANFYRDTTPEEQRLSGRSPDRYLVSDSEEGIRAEVKVIFPDALVLDGVEDEVEE